MPQGLLFKFVKCIEKSSIPVKYILYHDKLNSVNKQKGSSHVVRGENYTDRPFSLRCTTRKSVIKFMKSDCTGFKIVRKKIQQ